MAHWSSYQQLRSLEDEVGVEVEAEDEDEDSRYRALQRTRKTMTRRSTRARRAASWC